MIEYQTPNISTPHPASVEELSWDQMVHQNSSSFNLDRVSRISVHVLMVCLFSPVLPTASVLINGYNYKWCSSLLIETDIPLRVK